MGLGDYWRELSERLAEVYSHEEARSLAMVLLCEKTGVSKSHVLTNHPYPLSEKQDLAFKDDVERLKKFEPLQYIIGHTEFHGMQFQVAPGVLIPRPETEELISIVVGKHAHSFQSILDLCTGSGCIALSLKKEFPSAHVLGVDISDQALSIARSNSKQLELKVDFQKLDVLSTPWSVPKFDLIISNPPYVCDFEKAGMEPNVLNHEPHLALFVEDEDPVIFYRIIFREAQKHLNPGGWLYFETNPLFVDAIKNAMRWMGYEETEIIEDFRGKKRFVRGRVI